MDVFIGISRLPPRVSAMRMRSCWKRGDLLRGEVGFFSRLIELERGDEMFFRQFRSAGADRGA